MSVYRKASAIVIAAALGLGAVGVKVASAADAKGGDDSDIGAIMKKAFKGSGGGKPGAPGAGSAPKKPSLVQKATEGNATADELKSLLGYCQELNKAKPPKGDEKDWNDRTGKLVTAVEALTKGDKAGAQQLKAASNCKACHELHKES